MGCETGGVVVFDYTSWITQFPEFASVTQPVAQAYFDQLTIGGLIDNTAGSIIQNLSERAQLLNLGVAHIAQLSGALNPSARQVVGRVSSAGQGSVNAQFEMPNKGGAMAGYWNQTQYGARYYAATLKYRSAFYAPPVRTAPTLPIFGRYGFRRW